MSGIMKDEEVTVWRNLARRLLDHRGQMIALGE
jgi:hypothetical protein